MKIVKDYNYFRKRDPSQMLHWVVTTPLNPLCKEQGGEGGGRLSNSCSSGVFKTLPNIFGGPFFIKVE